MVGTCITTANSDDYKSLWDGKEPAAFGEDLDDLIPQFAESEAGQRFAQAWNNARIIVNVGGGHGEDDEETPTPTPPAP